MFRISVVRPEDADGLRIGAVGEIETAQAVVGGSQAEPGFRVARMHLGGVTEIFLGQPEIIGAVLLLAEAQGVVRIAAVQARFGGGGRAERRQRRLLGRLIARRRRGISVRALRFRFERVGEFSGAAARQPQAGRRNNQSSGNSNTHDKTGRKRAGSELGLS